MNMRLILLFLLLPAILFSQRMRENYNYSLDVVYGDKNYDGENDCKAICSLSSDGENIIIKVEVTDDKLIFNNSIYSDHIELWFGYDTKGGNKFAYIKGSDKYLYQYQNKPYLKSVIEEMKNPYIHNDVDVNDSKNYNLLTKHDWPLASAIDSYLRRARRDSLYKTYVFFGVTHFGINPDNGLVTFYDRENYNYFKKYLNTEIGELNNFVKAQTNVSKNKYTAKITISPEALGFVSDKGVRQLHFLINIVDSDKEGRQSSMFSTSKTQKWGDVDTFNEVSFKNNIDIGINPDFPFLGRDEKSSKIEDKLRGRIYDTFIYTDLGWKGVQRTTDNFGYFNYPDLACSLPNIQRYYFETNDLSASTIKVGNRDVIKYSFADNSYIKFGDEKILGTGDVIELFQLPNNKLAALIFEKSLGVWPASKLWFAREIGENILIGKEATLLNFILNGSIVAENYYTNSYATYPWKKIHLNNLSSNKIILDFEDKNIEVQWNNDGSSLKYKTIKQE